MKRPKVSVVIPTYNRAHYICETVNSVLAQTCKDYEIIVLDDGSTDNTKEVLQQYGRRIKYFYQENQGTPRAMNAGVRLSSGQYFVIVGDDDLLMPDMLEKQTKALDKDPELAFVCSGIYFIDRDGAIVRCSSDGARREKTFASLVEDNFVFHLSALVRRTCFEEVGGFDNGLLTTQDYDLWLRLSRKYKFGYTDAPLAKWRMHDGNLSKRLDAHLIDHIAIFKKKDVIEGMNGFSLWINKARIYYKFGRKYASVGLFAKAGLCYLKAVIVYPLIGYYFWPQETRKFRFSLPYRIMKVFLLPIICWTKALLNDVQKYFMRLHSEGKI